MKPSAAEARLLRSDCHWVKTDAATRSDAGASGDRGDALTRLTRNEAYRPFDGTDADVAELGTFELEMGPVHWYERAGQQYLLTPVTVLNFGILPGTELVFDFQGSVALGPLDGRPRSALLGTDIVVKHVLREGILQGNSGLSVALELGPLTPEINGNAAFGASSDLILSYRWDWGTVHFNEWPSYSRRHNLDLFSGVIVEGPHDWLVRPVTEVFYEKEFNLEQTASALLGVIWTPRQSFVLDLGLRGARVGHDNAAEGRLGFTWTIPSSSDGTASSLDGVPVTVAK